MIIEIIIEIDKLKVVFVLVRFLGFSKVLKFGVKGKEVDNFVDKLKFEGEIIMFFSMGKCIFEVIKMYVLFINMESVYMKIEEKIILICGWDGGL